MVVKSSPSSSAPSSPTSSSASSAASLDPLRGVRSSESGRISKDKEAEVEFFRLKNLVPAISKKQTVSKLDVILEAISYIDQLQDKLIDQMERRNLDPVAASALLNASAGKENAAVFSENGADSDDDSEVTSSSSPTSSPSKSPAALMRRSRHENE